MINNFKCNPEIIRLFPSIKKGIVEIGLWRIPLYFDKCFEKNRGCIRLRRYIVHMAEMNEPKEAMINKTLEIYDEFSKLIVKYSTDEETDKMRMNILDKYMMEFIDEISELIAKGDSTHIY